MLLVAALLKELFPFLLIHAGKGIVDQRRHVFLRAVSLKDTSMRTSTDTPGRQSNDGTTSSSWLFEIPCDIFSQSTSLVAPIRLHGTTFAGRRNFVKFDKHSLLSWDFHVAPFHIMTSFITPIAIQYP